MTARWLAFVIWAAVAATAVGWGLRLLVPASPVPLHAVTVGTGGAVRGDLSRLFGAEASPVAETSVAAPVDSRFRLVGVAAASGEAGGGVALIAVGDKPARAFRVGAVVEGDTILQAVRARGASLGPSGGQATVNLELPALPPPATGTLAAVGAPGVAPVSPAPGMAPGEPPPPSAAPVQPATPDGAAPALPQP